MKAIDGFLAFAGLLVVAAGYLVWENRASEKIMSAAIPTAIAGFVAVSLAVFIFGNQPPSSDVFPAAFQYNATTKLPWVPPWGTGQRWIAECYYAPAALKAISPERLHDPSDPMGLLLYHQLLQWAIVHWMAQAYGANWRAEILHFDLPDSREGSYRSTRTSVDDTTVFPTNAIESLLAENAFAAIHVSLPPTITTPKQTRLTIHTPLKPDQSGSIVISNSLVTLSVETSLKGYKQSVGTYAKLAELTDEEDQKLFTAIYLVRTSAVFSRWRSGNPKTNEYRAWAKQLLAELKDQFDEQEIWSRIKGDYLFRKQLAQ